jgi:hypothetical protein
LINKITLAEVLLDDTRVTSCSKDVVPIEAAKVRRDPITESSHWEYGLPTHTHRRHHMKKEKDHLHKLDNKV